MVYFFVWQSSLLLFTLGIANSFARHRSALAWATILLISLLSGIRWATGTDWAPYYIFYTANQTLSDFIGYFQFEIGFKLLVWFFSFLNVPYSGWLFLLAFFSLSLKFLPIINRPYVLVCFIVLFGATMADIFPVRQSLAISVVIYSARYLVNRRLLPFSALVLVASTLHVTAIVFLLAPIILYFSYGAILILALSLFLLFYFFFFHIAFAFFSLLGIENLAYLAAAYSQEIEGRVSAVSVIYKIVFLGFAYKAFPYVKASFNGFEKAALKFTVVGSVASIMLESISLILNRLSIYYFSFEFISASALIYFFSQRLLARKNYWSLLLLIIGVFFYYSLRFVGLFMNYSDLYYPFETVFDYDHKETY